MQTTAVFVLVPARAFAELPGLSLSPHYVQDYGAFGWFELSTADFAALEASGVPFDEAEKAGTLSVQEYQFDPQAQGEPNLPTGMRSTGDRPGFRLVQFRGPVKDEWLVKIGALGVDILQYYPNNAFLVWSTPEQDKSSLDQAFIRWTGLFHPAYRISPELSGYQGRVDNVAITFYNDGHIEQTLARLNALGGRYFQHYPAQPDMKFYTAIYSLEAARLREVSQMETVWAVEYSSPKPALDDELGDQIVAGNYTGGTPVTGFYTWLASKGINGTGITWADVDTGLNATHPDITGRAVAFVSYAGAGAANTDPDGHGSHTAGAIMGDGQGGTGITDPTGFYWGTGMAPEANLVVQNALMGTSWPPSGGWQVLSKDSVVNGAIGSSNSWYTGASGAQGYSSAARTHDLMVRDANFDTTNVAEPIIMVFSAGNNGPSASTLTEPKEAKNLITVGASQNYPRSGASINDIASFSSRGPALDGRLLPNVTAPGVQTASLNGSGSATCGTLVAGAGSAFYNYCQGTSMAAPFVSGSAALIAHWWGQQGYGIPSPAMVKALLINGGADMYGGNSGAIGHFPDNSQGWGRVNLGKVIANGLNNIYHDQDVVLQNTGDSWNITFGVPNPAQPLKISLVWTDAPGAVAANPALVNNLDLTVVNGANTYRGNQFSNGWSVTGGAADALNNIENVYINSPSGSASITIQATNIAGDGVPYNGDATDQDFALVCYNCALNPDFTIQAAPASQSICAPANATYAVTIGSILSYATPVTLSSSGAPAGTTTGFNPNPVTPPGTSQFTISNTGAATYGHYAMTLSGLAGVTNTHATQVALDLFTSSPGAAVLLTPANGALNQPSKPIFTWSAGVQSQSYEIQIATDVGFTNVVASATGLTNPTFTPGTDLLTNSTYYWRVRAQNACGTGNFTSPYTFTTAAAPGDCSTGTIPLVLYSDSFETGAAGWTHTGSGDTWALSSQRTHSGANAFKAVDPATASDQQLSSPGVALPVGQNPLTLKFWNHQTLEHRSAGGCYDGGLIEVSTDGGGTWTQVPNAILLTDPYDGAITTTSNPLNGKSAWCGDPQDWLNSIVDISAYAGQTVKFRFRLGSDSSVSREGWYVDDVVVQSCTLAGYNATLGPNTNLVGAPGSTVVHNFTLANLGLADSYTLSLTGSTWPTTLLTPSPVAVSAGVTRTISVQVSVPPLVGEGVIYGNDVFTFNRPIRW